MKRRREGREKGKMRRRERGEGSKEGRMEGGEREVDREHRRTYIMLVNVT